MGDAPGGAATRRAAARLDAAVRGLIPRTMVTLPMHRERPRFSMRDLLGPALLALAVFLCLAREKRLVVDPATRELRVEHRRTFRKPVVRSVRSFDEVVQIIQVRGPRRARSLWIEWRSGVCDRLTRDESDVDALAGPLAETIGMPLVMHPG